MADPVENAPMLTVNTLTATDTWVYRAVDKVGNVMYVNGNDSYLKALRDAKYLLKIGYLCENPIPRGHAKWIP